MALALRKPNDSAARKGKNKHKRTNKVAMSAGGDPSERAEGKKEKDSLEPALGRMFT